MGAMWREEAHPQLPAQRPSAPAALWEATFCREQPGGSQPQFGSITPRQHRSARAPGQTKDRERRAINHTQDRTAQRGDPQSQREQLGAVSVSCPLAGDGSGGAALAGLVLRYCGCDGDVCATSACSSRACGCTHAPTYTSERAHTGK